MRFGASISCGSSQLQAMTHLHQSQPLTFDSVSQACHEVTYDEVAKIYGGPISKHPVISVKGHPEAIWIRPDMGVGSVANSMAFGVGDSPRQIPWREVRRSLKSGYLPIVSSSWSDGCLLYQQLAFATLLESDKVTTGHEKQLAMVEISITNSDPSEPRRATLWVFAPCAVVAKGVLPFPYNTYDLFDVVGDLPAEVGSLSELADELLRDGPVLLGTCSADRDVQILGYRRAWRFEALLGPGQARSVRLVVSSNKNGLSEAEIERVRKIDFLTSLDRRVLDLKNVLKQGTQIRVPEDVVNNIYKAQILYNQAQMVQAADRDYCVPVQGFQGVWPWEAMKALTPLDAIGHHEDVRKCLGYFLKVQGRFRPQGDFKTTEGVFGGTIAFEESGWETDPDSTVYGQLARLNAGKEEEFPNWMNGTGAMLFAFGMHYLYTRDRAWLEPIAPALVRACGWIIEERQRTQQIDAEGQRVTHFGLLPIGRAYDTAEEAIRQMVCDGSLRKGEMSEGQFPVFTHHPCWTDSYSWQGLACAAAALADIGHPEGKSLVEEADAYRRDILEVLRRTRNDDLCRPPYPERLYRSAGWAEFATGALALVDTGLVDPHDTTFEQLENYMKKEWNREVVGLTGGLQKSGDPHGTDAFYVNFSEDIWHRAWMLRGDTEKALLTFYSMLAYGVDKETFGSVERFHLQDRRYTPFFMNTSGSARIVGLISQTLLFEHDKTIYLLAGVPRRWLEADKEIQVTRGRTCSAILSLDVRSEASQGRIRCDLVVSELRSGGAETVRLRVPHPARHPIQRVLWNGKPWFEFDVQNEVVELKAISGRQEVVVNYC